MPELYYGTTPEVPRRRLYSIRPFQQIESSIFDSWKIKNLAPREIEPNIAVFWWFGDRNHTALSWYGDDGNEQSVFLPGLIKQTDLLPLSRALLGDLIPSAIVFRVMNDRRPYLYD